MDWQYQDDAVLVPLDTLVVKTKCWAFECPNIATQSLLTKDGDNEGYCVNHAGIALTEALIG
jgi:hypothetical protein